MISIAIPMYNSSETIGHTIDSILNNGALPLEILILDDGSVDDSYQICRRYARENEQIILLSQNNKGVSAARNRLIQEARGQYIWFVDADDWIEPGSVLALMDKLMVMVDNSPDILFSNRYIVGDNRIQEDKKVFLYDKNILANGQQEGLYQYLYETINIGFSVWCHLFKTEFLRENHLLFNENLVMFEDMDWMLRVLFSAKTFDAYTGVIYRHRFNRNESLTRRTRTYSIFCNYAFTCIKWFYDIRERRIGEQDRRALLNQISDCYKCAFTFASKLQGEERKKAISLYMEHFEIVQYHPFQYFDRSMLIK